MYFTKRERDNKKNGKKTTTNKLNNVKVHKMESISNEYI